MTIDPELIKIYAGSNAKIQLDTLEFSHPLFTKPYTVVNDWKSWNFKRSATDPQSVEFVSVAFRIKVPNKDMQGRQELQIVMSNIARIMTAELELAQADASQPITCIYRVYFNEQDSAPLITPPMSLGITEITQTEEVVTATATRFDVLNLPFPTRHFTQADFPGLLR